MHKLTIAAFVLTALCAVSVSGRIYVIDDDFSMGQFHRVRRDTPSYGPPAPSYGPSHGPGRVGPVYTFVKTDPQGNNKWGVRHRVGIQYAG